MKEQIEKLIELAKDYVVFGIEIGTEKGSDVLEKALRIASGYNVE